MQKFKESVSVEVTSFVLIKGPGDSVLQGVHSKANHMHQE
jgi:hypothetical protein